MTKKASKVYKRLKKINRPVMLIVRSVDERDNPDQKFRKDLHKVRILYPDGQCEYCFEYTSKTSWGSYFFDRSCFMSYDSLSKTVVDMRKYDIEDRAEIVKVIPL